jgi:hypothetical protein
MFMVNETDTDPAVETPPALDETPAADETKPEPETPSGPEPAATLPEPEAEDGVTHTEPVRTLKAGTTIRVGHQAVKLMSDAVIEFDSSEQAFVGMLVNSGCDNLAINREGLELNYNDFGNVVD